MKQATTNKDAPRGDGAASLPIDLSPRKALEDSFFEGGLPDDTLELVAALAATRTRLLDEVGQIIVGQ